MGVEVMRNLKLFVFICLNCFFSFNCIGDNGSLTAKPDSIDGLSRSEFIETKVKGVVFLKTFYNMYITEILRQPEQSKNSIQDLDLLIKKHLSQRFINEISESREDLSLDYDPLICAQDFRDEDFYKVDVMPDTSRINYYFVRYPGDQEYSQKYIEVYLTLEKGSFFIDSTRCLDNKFYYSIKNTYTRTYNSWRVDCNNDISLDWFSGTLSLSMSSSRTYMIGLSKINVYPDVYDIFFSFFPGVSKLTKEMLNNQSYYSTSNPVGRIEILNNSTLTFRWFGVYNRKTKKRELTENPFQVKEQTVILKGCK